jgi:hypothetical protein
MEGSPPFHYFPLHYFLLAQALLQVLHDAHLTGVFALGGGDTSEVDLAGEGNVLLDLVFTGHGDTSVRRTEKV